MRVNVNENDFVNKVENDSQFWPDGVYWGTIFRITVTLPTENTNNNKRINNGVNKTGSYHICTFICSYASFVNVENEICDVRYTDFFSQF